MSEKLASLQCGIIMPISPIDGCSADHWTDVKDILVEAVRAIDKYNFEARLVSDADDIGVIQKRIVQNVYSSDIVICDVSGKNPNVMFELGMRLAFDKPTVIIKDDVTNYSFDTAIIEHLEYPRDLRFSKIVDFKERLVKKLVATYDDYKSNPNHSTFLKNFGKFTVASLDETRVTPDNMMLEMLSDIQTEIVRLRRGQNVTKKRSGAIFNDVAKAVLKYKNENGVTNILDLLGNEHFYRQLESELQAPRFFESQQDFREFVDSALRSIA